MRVIVAAQPRTQPKGGFLRPGELQEESQLVDQEFVRGKMSSSIARRCLVLLAAVVLLMASCSSSQESPTLTSSPPGETAVPAPPQVGASPSTTAASDAVATSGEDDAIPIIDIGDLPPPIDLPAGSAAPTTSTTGIPEFEDPDSTKLDAGEQPVSDSFPRIQELAAPVWQSQRILVARPDWRDIVPVYDAPNGSEISFKDGPLWSYTYRGSQLVVRVMQGSEGDEWVEAELPMRPWDNLSRPNGVRGWLRTKNFEWRTVNHHIQIDLADENGNPRVDFWDGDTWITGTYAIIGKASTHTPVMNSFLVEKFPGDNPVLGNHVMMLSGFSTALEEFNGGLPRIALHGTHIPERVGERLSNGCIRIPNRWIDLINQQAPLGTSVSIIA